MVLVFLMWSVQTPTVVSIAQRGGPPIFRLAALTIGIAGVAQHQGPKNVVPELDREV